MAASSITEFPNLSRNTSTGNLVIFATISWGFSVQGGSLSTGPFTKKPQDPDPGWTGPWLSTRSRICMGPVCSPAVAELGAGLEAGQAIQVLFPAMWKVFGQEGCPIPLVTFCVGGGQSLPQRCWLHHLVGFLHCKGFFLKTKIVCNSCQYLKDTNFFLT